jgi:hypothetical protein
MKAFHCAVWIDARELSHKAAAKHYDALLEGKIPQAFDKSVYAFFTDLTRRFPEPDEFPTRRLTAALGRVPSKTPASPS